MQEKLENIFCFVLLFHRLINVLVVSCSNRHLTAGLIYNDFDFTASLLSPWRQTRGWANL
jgi:hypothetical protein